ncbi:hypothetical protein [Nostoc sp.]
MLTMGCDAYDARDAPGLTIALGAKPKAEDLLTVKQSCSACLDPQAY